MEGGPGVAGGGTWAVGVGSGCPVAGWGFDADSVAGRDFDSDSIRLSRSDIWSIAFWYSRFMSSNCFLIWSSSRRSVSASWASAGPAASVAPSASAAILHLRIAVLRLGKAGGTAPVNRELSQALRGGTGRGGARGSA